MCDSDSDIDGHTGVFTFQNQSTNVSVRGPNVSRNFTMNFRNNMLTSTMNNMPYMPIDKSRYAESMYDQRSMYSRRETSPMSAYSASDMHARNILYLQSRGMGSHRSMYNGRGGSPFSVRTVDSNTSVSAVDIAAAFKTMHFNKNELRIIKEAYNTYMKKQIRKRIEKRRNFRKFMKGARRRSGGDSGDQGSDSSLSDDCRSTRSVIPRENTMYLSSTSRRVNLENFKKTLQDSNMYRDSTNSIKQNRLKNMLPSGPRSIPETFDEKLKNQKSRFQNQSMRFQNQSVMSQRERFTTGFLLPSQRFNHSTLMPISEKTSRPQVFENNSRLNTQNVNKQKTTNHFLSDTENEQEEIFSKTIADKSVQNVEKSINKRNLEDDGICDSKNKRLKKLGTPQKKKTKSKAPTPKLNRTFPKNDFNFAKPHLPIRKIGNKNLASSQKSKEKSPKMLNTDTQKSAKVAPDLIQNTTKENSSTSSNCKTKSVLTDDKNISNSQHQPETVISKSQPLPEIVISHSRQNEQENLNNNFAAKASKQMNIKNYNCQDKDETITETTDMSVRPSFIKRKLFSQKVDLADGKNSSSDCIENGSPPADIYSEIQKEKNRTRKLVTNQSCLNRDVLRDENNLLDLIQKIVPSDQLNATTAANRSEICSKYKSKTMNSTTAINRAEVNTKSNSDNKWKVDEILASSNNTGDMSDTYTDEEIFKCDETNIKERTTKICNNYKLDNEKSKLKQDVAKIKQNLNNTTKKVVGNPKESILESVVVVEKLSFRRDIHENPTANGNNGVTRNLYQCVKSFWDTDIDSDIEIRRTPLKPPQSLNTLKPAPSTAKAISKDRRTIDKTIPVKETAPPANTKSNILSIESAQTTKVSTVMPPKEKNNNQSNKSQKTKVKDKICDKPKGKMTLKTNENAIEKTTPVKETAPPANTKSNILSTDSAQTTKVCTSMPPKEKNNNQSNKRIQQTKLKDKICDKPKGKMTPKTNENANTVKKQKNKITLDNNLSNNASQSKLDPVDKSKKVNGTRTPKVKLCCTNARKSDNSFDDSTDTVYRNLRGRKVNLSTSIVSDCNPIPAKHKIARNKRLAEVSKKKDDSQSDLSFTLTSSFTAKPSRVNKNVNNSVSIRQSERLNRTKTSLDKSDRLSNLSVNRSTRMCLRSTISKPRRMW